MYRTEGEDEVEYPIEIEKVQVALGLRRGSVPERSVAKEIVVR
jgi:hypothetical protein